MPFDPVRNQHYNAAAIANVTGTSDATYSANEQTMLTDLQTAVNAILAALRTAGIVDPD